MTNDEMIAVIAAHRDGKALEWRDISRPADQWRSCQPSGVSWDFNRWEYRIKPEPREWWISVRGGSTHHFAFYNRESAAASMLTSEVIHVREVLP